MANKEGADANSRYDVYLCFKEADTRRTFTGKLYNALCHKRFRTFMDDDDDELQNGDQIFQAHSNALESSRVAIVVLSENFASSMLCLLQLAKILEFKEMKNQLVCPIFYDVDPSDVRHLRGSYGHAMFKHQMNYDHPDDKKVMSALTEVARFTEWHFRPGYQNESEFIQRIVEWVTQYLPRYNVFLSFRGTDTRYSFTGFLYNALRQKGFDTFMDDEGLKGGNQISLSLIKAIEESKLSIVVFSENYGYSSWCLDELVKILECMKMKNQLVWPIFYKVDPSDVRYQKNIYGDAMAKHEKRFGKDSEKVQKWRSALLEVANLKGWHYESGYEYEFIEKIVETVIDIENNNVILIPTPQTPTPFSISSFFRKKWERR